MCLDALNISQLQQLEQSLLKASRSYMSLEMASEIDMTSSSIRRSTRPTLFPMASSEISLFPCILQSSAREREMACGSYLISGDRIYFTPTDELNIYRSSK